MRRAGLSASAELLVTSLEEIMFSLLFVCLLGLRKTTQSIFTKFRGMVARAMEEPTTFWW